MDLELTEAAAECEVLLGGDVLLAEEQHLADSCCERSLRSLSPQVRLAPGGAYAGFKPVAQAHLPVALRQAAGVYRIPNFKFEMKIVYTNHVPMGHMRSPGGAQMIFAAESDMDRVAEAIG